MNTLLLAGFRPSDEDLLQAKSREAALHLLPVTIFVGVLMLFGLIGNGLACFYYWRRVQRTQTTNLILFVSILDGITSLVMPRTIIILMFTYRYTDSILCKFDAYTTYILVSFTILVLVVLAVTRHRLVCNPMMPKFSDRQVKIGVIVAMLMALAICSPCVVMYEAVPVQLKVIYNDTTMNITGHYCGLTKSSKLTIFKRIVNAIHFTLVVSSFVSLIALYCKIRQKIKEQDNRIKVHQGKATFKSYLNEVPSSAVYDATPRTASRADTDCPTRPTLEVPAMSGIREIPEDHRCTTIDEDTDYVFSGDFSETTVGRTENPSGVSPSLRPKKRKRRVKSGRKRLSTVAKQQTILIFTVTVTFMVSMVPYFVKSFFESFPVIPYDVGKVWIQFCYRSYLINSAVNPFIYGLFNEAFRDFVKGAFYFPFHYLVIKIKGVETI